MTDGDKITGLAGRILDMARTVTGRPYADWPAWSTGECLAVALVLDDGQALDCLGYTALQAVDRVSFELRVPLLLSLQRMATE